MSHPTIFLPVAFARPSNPSVIAREQDPQNVSDTPAGGATNTGSSPAGGTTGGTTGTTQGGDAKVAPQQGPCGGEMIWMMPVFLGLMYFFMIRPEQKRRKEQQALLSSIKQGDNVVTLSGMHGTVSRLTEKTVTLRIDTIEITFDRSAVSRIERDEAAVAPKN